MVIQYTQSRGKEGRTMTSIRNKANVYFTYYFTK